MAANPSSVQSTVVEKTHYLTKDPLKEATATIDDLVVDALTKSDSNDPHFRIKEVNICNILDSRL